MKKIISNLIVAFLMFYMISCTIGDTKTLSTNGSLKAESRSFKFGEIEKSEDMNKPFYFDIQNKSDTIIEIKKIDVSCGCIKINEYPKIVNPWTSIRLEGYIDLNGLDGFFEKSIYVNYKQDKLLLLRIRGTVKDNKNNKKY